MKGWCQTCRKMSPVVDEFVEETLSAVGREGFKVTELDCGHYVEGEGVRLGDAPGAPYAPTGPLSGPVRVDEWGDQ